MASAGRVLDPPTTGRSDDGPESAAALSNRWSGRSTASVDVRPNLARPGRVLRLTVRGLPAGAEQVWCHGGKLAGGADTGYSLRRRASGAWSARLPLARYATAGPIRLFLYAACGDAIDRHDITAGAVRTVLITPPAPGSGPTGPG